jgi:DNA-binding NarL/FixJ family response regulator
MAKKRSRTGAGQTSRPQPTPAAPPPDGAPAIDPTLAARLATLTPREVLDVFLDICHDKGVAHRLGRNVHTIRNQVTSIMHKLGVGSRTELIKTCLAHKNRDTSP